MKKALLIGINYTGQSGGELRGCENDVENIKQILINNCGYSGCNIHLLKGNAATRQNIQHSIAMLVKYMCPGDTLVFHYSGHGSYQRDTNGDEKDGQDEVLVPVDYKTNSVITDDWLNANFVNKIPKGSTLYGFIDACHSGSMLDLKYNYKHLLDNKYSLSLEKSNDIQGNVIMLSGCLDPQTSADAYINKTFQGAFSYCLIECLKKNIRQDDKRLQPIPFRTILKDINVLLKQQKFQQISQMSCGSINDLEKYLDL